MSLHRIAAKRDANEPAIVSALEALGCIVWRVSGKGLPDLIVLRAGKKWLADVKGPKEKPTPAQEKVWEEAATKARCAVFILRTPEDAQKMLNNALQPWEPEPWCQTPGCIHRGPCPEAKRPRKGDAAKAREQGLKRVNDEQWDVPLPDGRRLRNKPRTGAKAGRPDYVEAYTPPRSTPVDVRTRLGSPVRKAAPQYFPPTAPPVDAANEAEATFAPAEPFAFRCNASSCDCHRPHTDGHKPCAHP